MWIKISDYIININNINRIYISNTNQNRIIIYFVDGCDMELFDKDARAFLASLRRLTSYDCPEIV